MTDDDDREPLPARLSLREVHPGHVEVVIEPRWHPRWAEHTGMAAMGAARPSGSLLSYDATHSTLSIRPIVTNFSRRFLKPKHPPILEIALEDWSCRPPETEQEVRDMLQDLPKGFITTPEFGLGIDKEYLPILGAVRRLRGVNCLVLTRRGDTRQDENVFYMSYDDFDDVRRALHRVTSRYRAEARADRAVLAHNEILTVLDPVRFPEATRPYAPGTIFKLLSRRGAVTRVSRTDGAVLVKTLRAAAPALAESPDQLFALGETIERVALGALIRKFEALLAKGGSEAQWQALLDRNPFVLMLVFGYPIVKLASQGAVGGWQLAGGGGKVADFVVKNQLTQAVALVELKTPKTELVVGDYRKGVPSVSAKLTGAVMQVLDQRLKLQQSLNLVKVGEEDEEIRSAEAYGIDCIVIAGALPQDRKALRSFELFRGGLRDVRLFTFDELLAKMKALLAVLTAEPDAR